MKNQAAKAGVILVGNKSFEVGFWKWEVGIKKGSGKSECGSLKHSAKGKAQGALGIEQSAWSIGLG
jgi:hypothetical protein